MNTPAIDSSELKSKAIKASAWAAGLQFSTQISAFLIGLVLARLLSPADFGLASIVAILTAIGAAVADGGFSTAIIQKENLSDADCSTAFWFNMAVSLTLVAIVCLIAPLFASFFGDPRLIALMSASSPGLLIRAAVSCQKSRLSRSLNFRKLLACELPGMFSGACVGIPMALMGYGAWSLVAQGITSSAVTAAFIWIRSDWLPNWSFCRDSFRSMFAFGSKMALSEIIEQVFRNIYIVVIGRLFPLAEVGYYNRAQNFQQLVAGNVFGVVDHVMFPLLSSLKNDPHRLRRGFILSLSVISLVTFPVFTGLGVLAHPIILLLFGNRWIPSVPYLQILCGLGVLWPIHAANLSILRATGAGNIFLKLDVIKKALVVATILLTFKSGVTGMLWGQLACSVISLFINSHYNRQLIGISLWNQLLTMTPFALVAVCMGLCVSWSKLFDEFDLRVTLPLRITLGILTYAGCMKLLKLKSNVELADQFRNIRFIGPIAKWLLT